MPTLTVYSQPDFPPILKWQALAFMRTYWPILFQGEDRDLRETFPPQADPVHFVLADGDSLLSYAAILRLEISHAGCDYRAYGLGNVFTFPPFRGLGYGMQVVQAATRYLLTSQVDIAILFCQHTRQSFYRAAGWTPSPSPTRVGRPDCYESYPGARMMLFISAHGQAGSADFEREPLYISKPW